VTISSPVVLRPIADKKKPYRRRVKPFNFAISVHVASHGHLPGVDAERFHLIAPYERDAKRWSTLQWSDVYSGREFAITTAGPMAVGAVAVKSYRDVVGFFATHPESKSAEPSGRPCDRTSVGLLVRRPVYATSLVYVGKESRQLEEGAGSLLHDVKTATSHYRDEESEWRAVLLPFLRRLPRAVAASRLGITERAVTDLRTGKRRPKTATLQAVRTAFVEATRSLSDETAARVSSDPTDGSPPGILPV
jgi:hypothetical protein